METVSVLLSIYRPNPDYLREQLVSLNDQTYPDIELVIWNDCPDEEIDRELVESCITKFPVRYYDEKVNLGYIGAFSRLSELAKGEYVCYCDQDDIWEPDKIKATVEAIRSNSAVAAVCDKAIMDADGNIIHKSYREISHFQSDRWNTGDSITGRAAFFCYATGMAITARRETVQRYLPFIPGSAHDAQLMLFLSAEGRIAYVDRPLVRYRRHGKNETGTLNGVNRKKDYYDTRCIPAEALLKRFEELFPGYPELPRMKACCEARIRGNILGIWKYRDLIPDLYKYEAALALCPDWVFRALKGILFRKEG